MLNALSIDVEDYYQVSAFEPSVRFEDWGFHRETWPKNCDRGLVFQQRANLVSTLKFSFP